MTPLHIHDPDHGCRDCANTGTIRDEHTHIYGAFRQVRCHCRPVRIDATRHQSRDDLMDAAIADMGMTPAEYWAAVSLAAVVSGIAWIAADLLSAAVGVV